MLDQKNIQIKNIIPVTHFFIYKNKQYPIKFDFFKYSSKYFCDNQQELINSKYIPLLEPAIEQESELDSLVIEQFIKFCECEQICINKENVINLNYLSEKYEVQTLFEMTKEFIEEHFPKLAIELLLQCQKKSEPTGKYEKLIRKHLSEYINDDKLYKLSIPILSRILTNYNPKEEDDKIDKKQLIELLFKILDFHGRGA